MVDDGRWIENRNKPSLSEACGVSDPNPNQNSQAQRSVTQCQIRCKSALASAGWERQKILVAMAFWPLPYGPGDLFRGVLATHSPLCCAPSLPRYTKSIATSGRKASQCPTSRDRSQGCGSPSASLPVTQCLAPGCGLDDRQPFRGQCSTWHYPAGQTEFWDLSPMATMRWKPVRLAAGGIALYPRGSHTDPALEPQSARSRKAEGNRFRNRILEGLGTENQFCFQRPEAGWSLINVDPSA